MASVGASRSTLSVNETTCGNQGQLAASNATINQWLPGRKHSWIDTASAGAGMAALPSQVTAPFSPVRRPCVPGTASTRQRSVQRGQGADADSRSPIYADNVERPDVGVTEVARPSPQSRFPPHTTLQSPRASVSQPGSAILVDMNARDPRQPYAAVAPPVLPSPALSSESSPAPLASSEVSRPSRSRSPTVPGGQQHSAPPRPPGIITMLSNYVEQAANTRAGDPVASTMQTPPSANASLVSPRLHSETAPSNSGQVPATKRRRIASAPSTILQEVQAATVLGFQLKVTAADQGLGSHNEQLRYKILKEACGEGDVFYVALHQIFCMWTENSTVIRGRCIESARDLSLIENAVHLMGSILKKNSQLRPAHVKWFSDFPGDLGHMCATYPEYAAVVEQVLNFLDRMARYWVPMLQELRQRSYPLLMDELLNILHLYSPMLQMILFRASRRTIGGLDGPVGNKMEDLFVRDQQAHRNANGEVLLRITRNILEDNSTLIDLYRGVLAAAPTCQGHLGHQFVPAPTGAVMSVPSAATPWPQVQQQKSGLMTPWLNANATNMPNSRGNPGTLRPEYPGTQNTGANFHNAGHHNAQYAGPVTFTGPSGPLSCHPLQGGLLPHPPIVPSNDAQQQPHQPSSPRQQIVDRQVTQSRRSSQPMPQAVTQGLVSSPGTVMANAPAQMQQPLPYTPASSTASPGVMPSTIRATPSGSNANGLHDASYASTGLGIDMSRTGRSNNTQPPRVVNSPAGGHRSGTSQTARSTPISSADYPHDPYDRRSIEMSMHQVLLRSPRRMHVGPAYDDFLDRHYQSLESMLLSPTPILPLKTLITLRFVVGPEVLDKLSKDRPARADTLPVNRFFSGSTRIRLRSCMQSMSIAEMSESSWAVAETAWPTYILMQLNGHSLSVRRKMQHSKDQPVEIGHLLKAGENVLQLTMQGAQGAAHQQKRVWLAVEMIQTLSHRAVLELPNLQPLAYTPAASTRDVVRKRLQKSRATCSDDDIALVDDTLGIHLRDPFSSSIFRIPVRGEACQHLECFDLETWLKTRPSKKHCVCATKSAACKKCPPEPSLVDKWRCPLCSSDARPYSLRVDGFLVEVRQALEAAGQLGTKLIMVSPDGSWRPKIEDDDDGASSEGEASRGNGQAGRRASASTNAQTSANPSKQPVQIIQLD